MAMWVTRPGTRTVCRDRRHSDVCRLRGVWSANWTGPIQSAVIGGRAMTLPMTETVPDSATATQRHEPLPHVDRLVVGAGLFGLYGALLLARRGLRVAILDADQQPMMRAS